MAWIIPGVHTMDCPCRRNTRKKKKKKEKSNFQIKLYPGLGIAVGGLWGLEEINPPIPTILPLQSLIQVPLLTIDLLIIIIIFYKKLIKNLNIN